MLKKIVALLCLMCLTLPLLSLSAFAENTPEPFYAYFEDARWLRTEPKANTPTVVNVPKRSVLLLMPIDDKYASTTYRGQAGYIYYKDYKTINYTAPTDPEAVTVEGFFGAPVYMRAEPLKNAPTLATLPNDVRFQITYVTESYAYITAVKPAASISMQIPVSSGLSFAFAIEHLTDEIARSMSRASTAYSAASFFR